MNLKLYELFADIDINRHLKNQWLRWLGHVVGMDITAPANKLFIGVANGTRRREATRLCW